jgi:DNA-binding PadR family transcriptional regulator
VPECGRRNPDLTLVDKAVHALIVDAPGYHIDLLGRFQERYGPMFPVDSAAIETALARLEERGLIQVRNPPRAHGTRRRRR